MTLLFNKWGLSGPLSTFPVWLGNGVQGDWDTIDPAIIGDRADIVMYDGYPAYRITHHAGDVPLLGNRTELHTDLYSHIADWVGEGVPGAVAANAIRQYRVKFLILSGTNLNYVGNSHSPFFIVHQLHQVHDDNPGVEDTQGLNPTLSIRIRLDAGAYKCSVIRNIDTTPQITVANPAIQQQECCSWPFSFDTWYDIHIAVKWSYSALGNMTIYLNRYPVFVEVASPNCPNNSLARGGAGQYAKIGPYLSFDEEISILHRGCLIADGTNFAEMYPELSAAQAIPLERVARSNHMMGSFGGTGI